MNGLQVKDETKRIMVALPALVDGLTAVVLIVLLPGLMGRLLQPGGWNAALLVTLYVFFCVGVYLIRKLLPEPEAGHWGPPAWFMDPRVRGLVGAVFGLLMMTTLAYQLGYFAALDEASLRTMGEGDSSVFFLFGPGAWLGFSMLVILVLAFPVNATVAPGTRRYTLFATLGLLFTNSLLVLVTAQARAVAQSSGRMDSITAVVAIFAALLLSFAPARLLYQDRQPHLSGLISFGLLILLATGVAAL